MLGPSSPEREMYQLCFGLMPLTVEPSSVHNYVGDDDSTTIADILNKVPYKVEK